MPAIPSSFEGGHVRLQPGVALRRRRQAPAQDLAYLVPTACVLQPHADTRRTARRCALKRIHTVRVEQQNGGPGHTDALGQRVERRTVNVLDRVDSAMAFRQTEAHGDMRVDDSDHRAIRLAPIVVPAVEPSVTYPGAPAVTFLRCFGG